MEIEKIRKNKRKKPYFMLVKTDIMERVIAFSDKNVKTFACNLDIDMLIAYIILSGEKLGVHISRKFIRYYTAEYAHRYINWEAMEMQDPYKKMRKQSVQTRHFDRRNNY